MATQYALLPYQQRWIADHSRVKIMVKSRRIGITWATAADCVLDAADGTCDSWYINYSEDGAQEFILDATKWVHAYGMVDGSEPEECWVDPDTGDALDPAIDKAGIKAFRLAFRSGKRITALSSRPRNLRGKAGRVVIDEAAYHEDLPGLLKAALALLMWGGGSRVEIISTHCGIDNAFNVLIESVRSGEHPTYSLHSVDLDQALAEGLHQRISLVNGEPWTQEAQDEWRATTVQEYGVGAEEELFCRPNQSGGGDWFHRSKFTLVDSIRDISFRPPEVVRALRFWDLAATKPSAANPDPDYTTGARVLMLSDGNFLIDDMVRIQEGPGEVEAYMVGTAEADGSFVETGTWQDPAAAGKSDIRTKGVALTGYVFHSPRASANKISFAKVWASLALQGRIYILRRGWTEALLQELERFPGGKHDDQVDAISGAFEVLVGVGGYATTWASAWEA